MGPLGLQTWLEAQLRALVWLHTLGKANMVTPLCTSLYWSMQQCQAPAGKTFTEILEFEVLSQDLVPSD